VVEAGTLAAMANPLGLRSGRGVERGVVGRTAVVVCRVGGGYRATNKRASGPAAVVMRRESGPVTPRASQRVATSASFGISSGDNTPNTHERVPVLTDAVQRSSSSICGVGLLAAGRMGMQEMQVSW
jgi:hypothetical protein